MLCLSQNAFVLHKTSEYHFQSRSLHSNNMQDNVSELRFFVTTQKDHSRKALSWTQISDVRSHCAIRQHASRRAKQGLPISPKRKRKSRTIIQNVLCTGEQLFPYEPTTQALVPTTPVLPDSATIACQELCEAKLWHGLDDIFPLSIPPDEPVVTNLSPIPEPTSSVSSSASPRESNGQHQDVPKKPWMQPPPIFQIFSTLDPFIRLPVEVTDEDRRALQFCQPVIPHSLDVTDLRQISNLVGDCYSVPPKTQSVVRLSISLAR